MTFRSARSFMSTTRFQTIRRVDLQPVAVVDVVVQQRGQQVVGEFDGVEVAGEVEVDVFHRHDLGISAPAAPPFMPKHGPSDGSRRHTLVRLPIRFRPSHRPMLVVVLPRRRASA